MSGFKSEIVIAVQTGDIQGAGTNANVAIKLHDKLGKTTEKIILDNFFKNDFEKGNRDVFQLPREKTDFLQTIHKLEVIRDESGINSSWYVEKITVENRATGDVHIFPVFRWLRPHYHYIFREHDTFLPQDDDQLDQRKLDLEEKRKTYQVNMSDPAFPAMVTSLPVDEQFSAEYRWDMKKQKYNLIAQSQITILTTGSWETLEDLKQLYTRKVFTEPVTIEYWKEDWFFGYQRLNGPAPNIIRRCTQIPEKLSVKEEDVSAFLEGNTLKQAIEKKLLFYCDLHFLNNVEFKSKEYVICAPIVLLFMNKKNQLLPIAIQLFQEKSPNNPVFLPSDDSFTWLLAKMWYNQAEATCHQALTHLGYTHLMMEGVCLALHRTVSVSHPVFKLLAPHLMYLLAINNTAVMELLSVGGWIDKTMSSGREGVIELVKQGFKTWRLDVEGCFPDDLHRRGVYDKDVLPGYHYRDDALLLWETIQRYVSDYVNVYYETSSALHEDNEIQAWGRELTRSRQEGGMGIQGVPGNGEFKDVSQLIKTLTCVIFTCSVQHAAVNFPQYDYYGFPPTYPLSLTGTPPADKKPRTERDVINALPDKGKSFDAMIVTKILSTKGVKSLGDFELQYISDPKAKHLVEKFRDDLRAADRVISTRNTERDPPYDFLQPDSIPNSISI